MLNELLNCFKEKEILLLLFYFTIFSFIVVMTLTTSIIDRIIEGASIFNKSFKEMTIYVLTNHKIDTFIVLFFTIISLISLILIFGISGIVYFCIYMFIIVGKIIHHFKIFDVLPRLKPRDSLYFKRILDLVRRAS